ncbi:MAG: ferrous iron transport protein B [Firmicutes bacterium]|jgi:ferrous iron transport protein B|nr:ferrous iron transport protein B [Bacillota bacterium]NBI63969.1 ferrous iron transport protein B [Clostridiales bacterium]
MKKKTIALAGNPNVGKSTVFNSLTGLNQHTGNWPGKTVTGAQGKFTYKDTEFLLVDLPGTYSLAATSMDEAVARDYICSGKADITLVVADGTCLERNLNLVLQVLSITKNVILCVNLLDEAKKKKIMVDLDQLSDILNIPVIGMAARSKEGLDQLLEALWGFEPRPFKPQTVDCDPALQEEQEQTFCSEQENKRTLLISDQDHAHHLQNARSIYAQCVTEKTGEPHAFDRKLDQIVTSRKFGFPIMLLLLGLVFWITIAGANYPSQWLTTFFAWLETQIREFFQFLSVPATAESLAMDGIYKTLTWVISVMLPPMAIFFPLFTLLEDFGYLPRVAFNLDHAFKKCCAHGKQALTICMGFGCNACGVTGCRIIESPRERLIAILTNSFVPCNGRFPTLIAIITMFFVASFSFGSGAAACLLLTLVILLGIVMTLLVSKLLSHTILKGMPSSFILELPPYRCPKIGSVIFRSILDRTLFVLGRAVVIAAPAGLLIWLLANITWGETSILSHCTDFCDPFGRLLGIDGVIVMAFILGFPANEIVVPIMLMTYMAQGSLTDYDNLAQLQAILLDHGWTWQTALATMILCLFHFPCGTTCLTIKKETGSWKWTAAAFLLPTLVGIILCLALNGLWTLFA